ncbi:MAG: OadG family protein [Holdemanella sp.]|nr:OadG family protein [Holdemanella sp.]
MIETLTPIEGILIAIYGFITVFIMLTILMVVVIVLGKIINAISGKEQQKTEPVVVETKVEEPKIDTTEYVGNILLYEVDEKTAACIMAIVSDQTGIPLNNLIFKKIKYLGEE